MAKYGIFVNDVLERLATDETNRDYLMGHLVGSVAKTITDTQFDDVGKEKKFLTLDSNGNIVETTDINPLSSQGATEKEISDQSAYCQQLIDLQISRIKSYLPSHEDHSEYSYWKDYMMKLKGINVSTMSFPMTQTFQEWFNSQEGYPTKYILQVP